MGEMGTIWKSGSSGRHECCRIPKLPGRHQSPPLPPVRKFSWIPSDRTRPPTSVHAPPIDTRPRIHAPALCEGRRPPSGPCAEFEDMTCVDGRPVGGCWWWVLVFGTREKNTGWPSDVTPPRGPAPGGGRAGVRHLCHSRAAGPRRGLPRTRPWPRGNCGRGRGGGMLSYSPNSLPIFALWDSFFYMVFEPHNSGPKTPFLEGRSAVPSPPVRGRVGS